MRGAYATSWMHKMWTMAKLTVGFWDKALIHDLQAPNYRKKFYVPTAGGDEGADQLDDLVMLGTSHSLFWMFMPYTYLAVLFKWGEANNASPFYVATTAGLQVKPLFGKGMTPAKFVKHLFGFLDDPESALDALRAGPADDDEEDADADADAGDAVDGGAADDGADAEAEPAPFLDAGASDAISGRSERTESKTKENIRDSADALDLRFTAWLLKMTQAIRVPSFGRPRALPRHAPRHTPPP